MDNFKVFQGFYQFKRTFKSTIYFSKAILKGSLKNLKALAISLGLPIFMLFTIWAPAMSGDEESKNLLQVLFPAIVILTVIMPGLTQATRLTQWKEQQIFRRLALTPVPLSNLIIGASIAQVVIGIAQGIIMLLFGYFMIGFRLNLQSFLFILTGMTLAGATFISYGSMLAVFSQKPDIAGYLFFFTVMPLTFLASFPPDMLPDAINTFSPWLPTSMAIDLIGSVFIDKHLSEGPIVAGIGLCVYIAIFIFIIYLRKYFTEKL